LTSITLPMGGDHNLHHLHCLADCIHSHLSALSRTAQAGPGLLPGHAPCAAEVPGPADRTGACTRPLLAAHYNLEALADCARVRSDLRRGDLRRRVALRQISDVAREREPLF